jgi:hypothetical protein
LRSLRDTRHRTVASPFPLNGERIRRTSSRLDPLNPVGTRSTASPSSGLQLGTQWNASLPVPAGRFMGRAGVRGEWVKKHAITGVDLRYDCPHLTLPSPFPPGAEREDPGPLSGQRAATHATTRPNVTPSPLNGERAGVRGEKLKKRPISPVDLRHDRPHLTLPSPLPPGAERDCFGPSAVHPVSQTISGCDAPSPSPLNGERAGVRGEKLKKPSISRADLQDDRPPLTLPSPFPPAAEREDRRTPAA